MDGFTLSGLIFMVVLGPAVGNYLCSVVYRLPRGQTPFEKKPYCGHCGTMLQPRDLFPILSYVLNKGRCRYCSGTIPACYTWIECWCLLIFVGHFLLFGVNDTFLLLTSFACFLLTLTYIALQSGFISSFMMVLSISAIALYRAIGGANVLEWFQGGLVCAMLGLAVWQATQKGKGKLADVPHYVWMMGLSGAALPLPFALVAVLGAVVLYMAQRIFSLERSSAPAFAIAIHLMVLAHAKAWVILP